MIPMTALYAKFLFQRTTILIMLLFYLIVILGVLNASGIFLGFSDIDMYRREYEISYIQESITLIKTIVMVLAIFLTAYMNSNTCNNLAKYLVDKPLKKWMMFYSKIILLLVVVILHVLLFSLFMSLITSKFTPFIVSFSHNKDIFFYITLQAAFYVCFTNILLSIAPNILVSIVPIMLYWYMELNHNVMLFEANKFLTMLYTYIINPIYANENFVLFGDIQNYVLFIMILLFTNSLYITKKDIL